MSEQGSGEDRGRERREPDFHDIWWGSILWRARAGILIFLLAAAALTLPPQMQDMLSNLADFDDMTPEGWLHALGFHLAMIVMALSLWYWARAVLLAWFDVDDTPEARLGLHSRLQIVAGSRGEGAHRAFESLPRLLFIGTALVAALATARSDKSLQTGVVMLWLWGLHAVLHNRLAIMDRFGFRRPVLASSFSGSGWKLRWRLMQLLLRAPFGLWPALILLLLGSALFLVSFATAFVPDSIAWKTYPAKLLPGPSVALLLMGLSVAPLTALTYALDTVTRAITILGVRLRLRYAPVLTGLLLLMGGGASIMSLHSLRAADPGAPGPDRRASLAVFFQSWARTCAQGDAKTPVRPIIVAVSGGASRAGLWAAKVLDSVDVTLNRTHAQNAGIFAVSSVSGGSLGAAAYVSMRAGQKPDGGCSLAMLDGQAQHARDVAVTEAMRADALGPALAGMLLGDAPRALAAYLAWPVVKADEWWTKERVVLRGNDRAEALERAFERNWLDNGIVPIMALGAGEPVAFNRPYLSLFYDGAMEPRGDVPLWLANGTDLDTGDRLLTAPFKVDYESFCGDDGRWYRPEGDRDCGKRRLSYAWNVLGPFHSTRDVLSLLKTDIPISTAIDNTSRFPFLSPSGELTPAQVTESEDAQIIDGGYFENEGLMTGMELANWLKTYGPALIGRPVYPIIVQATANADRGIDERDIARCGNRLPVNPAVSAAETRSSQFLVPLIGLSAVRGGHSHALLKEAQEEYCDQGGQQAFFHFYLYSADGFDVPLNWMLSEKVADYIWDDAIAVCGNAAELMNLEAALRVPPGSLTPPAQRPRTGSREIATCTNAPVKVKLADLPRLETGLGAPLAPPAPKNGLKILTPE
jgi:hypothetical protein